jgi:hypothetical protein
MRLVGSSNFLGCSIGKQQARRLGGCGLNLPSQQVLLDDITKKDTSEGAGVAG